MNHTLKIVEVINETESAKTLVLEPVSNWIPIYKSGQFMTLLFHTPYGEKRRSYSLSSSPDLNEPLSITVKKVDNGEFSRFILHHLNVGDHVTTSGIGGYFVLPETAESHKQYFLIAAGSGITPCFSLIKTILATKSNKIVLIYSNKKEEDALFYQQLHELQMHYSERFKVRFLFSNNFSIYHSRLSHWLLEQLLKEYLEVEAKDALFYVCGPFEYMQTVMITLLSHVPAKNILRESFDTLPRKVIPKPPDLSAHEVSIYIDQAHYKFTTQYPQSILASAKAHHISLPYSCEAGRCSSCVATCTKGKVWMAYNEVLTDEELEKGRILVCQSYPIDGNVEIVF